MNNLLDAESAIQLIVMDAGRIVPRDLVWRCENNEFSLCLMCNGKNWMRRVPPGDKSNLMKGWGPVCIYTWRRIFVQIRLVLMAEGFITSSQAWVTTTG